MAVSALSPLISIRIRQARSACACSLLPRQEAIARSLPRSPSLAIPSSPPHPPALSPLLPLLSHSLASCCDTDFALSPSGRETWSSFPSLALHSFASCTLTHTHAHAVSIRLIGRESETLDDGPPLLVSRNQDVGYKWKRSPSHHLTPLTLARQDDKRQTEYL